MNDKEDNIGKGKIALDDNNRDRETCLAQDNPVPEL